MKFYLFKNLLYLCKYNLKKIINNPEFSLDEKMCDAIKYSSWLQAERPVIKDFNETIDELINTNKSCVRLGDGELQLILGQSIPFQRHTKKIQEHLYQALINEEKNILTCIPRVAYYPESNMCDITFNFWKNFGFQWRNLMNSALNFNKTFGCAEFTLATSVFKKIDIKSYFCRMQQIWNNKDITIICGETVFSKAKYNIFDNAKTIEYQYTPASNAYDEYEKILEQAKKIDKGRMIIIICGPTATVLAYDLACSGYRALDLGHVVKSYDWYCSRKNIDSMASAVDFFGVD